MSNWNEFAALVIPGHFPNQLGWHPNESILPAETCARHVYIGLKEAFNDAPDILKNRLKIGLDAYTFVMHFASGLKSGKIFDEEVSGQLRKAWIQFEDKNCPHKKRLHPYIQEILHDIKLVKSAILKPHSRRPTEINSLRTLAHLSPEKQVLLVCGSEASSLKVITGIGNRRPNDPGKITLTHPDEETLSEIHMRLNQKEFRKSLAAELDFVSWNDISWSNRNNPIVQRSDAFLVLQPMAAEPSTQDSGLFAINDALCQAWMIRCEKEPQHNAKLIHLKGNPHERGNTTGQWRQFGPEHGFVPYTAIREETSNRFKFIKKVAEAAVTSIEYLGAHRINGDRVEAVVFNPETMDIDYKLARRPQCRPSVQAPQVALAR